MQQQLEYFFQCPHCWEDISMLIELHSGTQQYIEDCEVCCNPIQIHFTVQDQNIVNFDAFIVQ